MSALLNAFLAGCCAVPAFNAYLAGDTLTAGIAGAFGLGNALCAVLYVRGL